MPFHERMTFATSTTVTTDLALVAANPNLRITGYSVAETTNAVAYLVLRHGTTDTDPIFEQVRVAAHGYASRDFMAPGVPVANGIYIDRIAGKTEVTVRYTTGS